MLPETATNKKILWKSSNPKVATVTQTGGHTEKEERRQKGSNHCSRSRWQRSKSFLESYFHERYRQKSKTNRK
ncbi:MAG: Ig domain-containing protein [Anaerobutyricum soehngenii]